MMGPYLLLLAESMVQRPKRNSWDSIQAAYRTAVEVSQENGGNMVVECYSFERLSALSKKYNDAESEVFYLKQALESYTRWGATAKISVLSREVASLCSS